MAVPQRGILAAMQTDSKAITNRLRRIEGQVRGLQRMVEEDAYCVDVLTQVAAVQTALEQVAVKVLDGHVRHCVADAVAGEDEGPTQARRADGGRQRFTRAAERGSRPWPPDARSPPPPSLRARCPSCVP